MDSDGGSFAPVADLYEPIRVWLEVGDRDFLNPNVMRDGTRIGL